MDFSFGLLVYINAVWRQQPSRELHQALVGGASPAKVQIFHFLFNRPRPPKNGQLIYAAWQGDKGIQILLQGLSLWVIGVNIKLVGQFLQGCSYQGQRYTSQFHFFPTAHLLLPPLLACPAPAHPPGWWAQCNDEKTILEIPHPLPLGGWLHPNMTGKS